MKAPQRESLGRVISRVRFVKLIFQKVVEIKYKECFLHQFFAWISNLPKKVQLCFQI